MLNQIPQSRVILYVLILCALPLLLALTYSLSQATQGRGLIDQTVDMRERAAIIEAKRAPNRSVIQAHAGADPLYLHKQLEPLQLLQEEIDQLKAILKLDTLGVNEDFQARLDYLTNENKIDFDEGETKILGNMKETIQSTTRVIETSNKDLMKILALIEGVNIGPYTPAAERPELLITDCKISRKKGVGDNEVFSLSLKLVKREFSIK